jgi:hypothetical protein
VSGFSPVTLPFLGLVFVVALCVSILAVWRDHTDNAHTLWYVFSLTLCSVSVLFFYIYENSRAIQSTPLSGMAGTIAVTFVKASMDVQEEIYILLTEGALLILPPILSYLINGIFGCGFAIEAKALILEESAEEITSTNDSDSEKAVYAKVSKPGQTAELRHRGGRIRDGSAAPRDLESGCDRDANAYEAPATKRHELRKRLQTPY